MVGVDTEELVRRAAEDDPAAWEQLVDRFTRLVWHVVNGFGSLPVEVRADIHQTTWLRLAERIGTLHDPSSVGSWLATTARRECLRQLKRTDRETPMDVLDLAPDLTAVDTAVLDNERDAALWRAFDQLDERAQQLLRLLITDPPFSYAEIAVILDMPHGSIGPTRARCLEVLRSELAKTYDGEVES